MIIYTFIYGTIVQIQYSGQVLDDFSIIRTKLSDPIRSQGLIPRYIFCTFAWLKENPKNKLITTKINPL